MKIFVDGTFYKASGIGRYYSNLLELLSEGKNREIVTTVPKRLKEDWSREFGDHENVTPIFVDYEKFDPRGFLWGGKILKELEKECRVFWFPHVNLPFYVPKNTIVTVHDLCPLTPWWDRSFMSKVMFAYLLKRAVKKAKLIVVPSNFTKGELLKRFPEAKGKVEVVYNFVSEKFFVGSATTERPAVEGDYILFVGNRKKHKNLKNLVLAFSLLVDRFGYKLVIVGGRDKNQKEDEMDRLIRELGIDDRVVQLDKASDETLMNLYKNAKLLVLPSFYEGFGLPPLEALACGCPVIVSKIPVFEETLGSEIALFDPSSVDDMKAKIEEALMDPSKRLRILEIGKEILPKFSKERVAKDYERILSSV